jgi:hypothetical protein
MTDEERLVEAPAEVGEPVRNGPKWKANVKERVQAAIRRYSRPPADLGAEDANEGDAEPRPERTPPVSADLQRIRTELADAGIAARRTLERVRVAHVIIAAAAQVVIAFIGWRLWVWRAQRRRQ